MLRAVNGRAAGQLYTHTHTQKEHTRTCRNPESMGSFSPLWPILNMCVLPPSFGWRSSTTTRRPVRARVAAHDNPPTPPPSTSTSTGAPVRSASTASGPHEAAFSLVEEIAGVRRRPWTRRSWQFTTAATSKRRSSHDDESHDSKSIAPRQQSAVLFTRMVIISVEA